MSLKNESGCVEFKGKSKLVPLSECNSDINGSHEAILLNERKYYAARTGQTACHCLDQRQVERCKK